MRRIFPLLALLALLAAACADAPKGVEAALAPDGKSQSIDVFVDHAYTPAEIILKAGVPATLNFYRKEKSESCARDLEIPAVDVKADLPNFKVFPVAIPAQKAGTVIPFRCSMDMMRGRITVQ